MGTLSPPPAQVKTSRRVLIALLCVVGILLVGEAIVTLAWREPLSSLYAAHRQSQLDRDLARLERSAAPPPTLAAVPARSETAITARPRNARRAPERTRARAARRLDRRARAGRPLGRLVIDRIGVRRVLVEGTGAASLRSGPAHYADTTLPGGGGTVGIAGHRTTYLAPFRRLNELRTGHRIEVDMPYGTFTYRVERSKIVLPEGVGVLKRAPYERLVLTACHPLHSDARRIVVFSRLVRARG
jgi:sortase A